MFCEPKYKIIQDSAASHALGVENKLQFYLTML